MRPSIYIRGLSVRSSVRKSVRRSRRSLRDASNAEYSAMLYLMLVPIALAISGYLCDGNLRASNQQSGKWADRRMENPTWPTYRNSKLHQKIMARGGRKTDERKRKRRSGKTEVEEELIYMGFTSSDVGNWKSRRKYRRQDLSLTVRSQGDVHNGPLYDVF